MVIVKLCGGLGNQLFQYALGKRLADERDVPLKLDLRWFYDQPQRPYRLDRFRIEATKADPREIDALYHLEKGDIVSRLIHCWERLLPYYQRSVIFEKDAGFDPMILKAPVSVYLVGFWQSPQYFAGIDPLLRQELELVQPVHNEKILHMMEEMDSSNSISLHIRRGDYVDDAKTAAYHGVCPISYYQQAVEYLADRESGVRVYVFSDDIEWAQQNLHLNLPTEFVSGRFCSPDYIEMDLMRHCKHHIIANSSFSWWAAWLSNHPGKMVIAPRVWFTKKDKKDIIPSDWMRL